VAVYKAQDLLQKTVLRGVSLIACSAEFVAMTLFVVIGCGSAMGINGTRGGSDEQGATSALPGWVLMVSLAFGFAIAALAYAIGHHSGGHMNCAVTLGLVLAGECGVAQGIGNFIAQMFGSILGAGILCLIFPAEQDKTGGLGANGVADGWEWYNALVGEIMGTFLLMYVVLQTACHPKSAGNRAQAALAIGLAVFMAHVLLIPVDGCSINPTRSMGPALVAQVRYGKNTFKDIWIFWLGPLVGAALAAGSYKLEKMLMPASAPVPDDAPKTVGSGEVAGVDVSTVSTHDTVPANLV